MALLTITPANVGVGSLASSTRVVQVGEAVAQGEVGYRNATDGKYYKADANDADKDAVEVVFLTPASTDGYAVAVLTGSSVKIGATLTIGKVYYLAPTVGRIGEESDVLSGDYVTVLGVASTTEILNFNPNVTGVAKP